jgi:hypothetical protein
MVINAVTRFANATRSTLPYQFDAGTLPPNLCLDRLFYYNYQLLHIKAFISVFK